MIKYKYFKRYNSWGFYPFIYSQKVSGFQETIIGFDSFSKMKSEFQQEKQIRLSVDWASVDRPYPSVDRSVDRCQQKLMHVSRSTAPCYGWPGSRLGCSCARCVRREEGKSRKSMMIQRFSNSSSSTVDRVGRPQQGNSSSSTVDRPGRSTVVHQRAQGCSGQPPGRPTESA